MTALNCPKVFHDWRKGGYLHSGDDDRSYDVDGVLYCGRCHHTCDAQGRCNYYYGEERMFIENREVKAAARIRVVGGKKPLSAREGEECRDCDGCGWYEGGKTLMTTCHKCEGTGWLTPESK